jgi:hypothetical protein
LLTSTDKSRKHALVATWISSLFVPWLYTIPPRACFIALNYSQTFLLNDAVSYLVKPPQLRNKNNAYGMIGAAVLIYWGKAVRFLSDNKSLMLTVFKIARANQQGKLNQMSAAFRGLTVALIYDKSLHYPAADGDLPAITLMSTDIDQVMAALVYMANAWANLAETAIGIWLVWRQMGPIALAPILVVILCSVGSIWLGWLQGKARGIWVQAVQRRIGFTARTLGSMKSVKLAGMADISAKLLQVERKRELDKAKDLRWNMVWQNAIGKSWQLALFRCSADQLQQTYHQTSHP